MLKSLINYTSSPSPSPSPSSSSSPSSTSSSSSSTSSPTRCTGLNLLVKAIHHVTAGSVIGVPYFQKRIITRRRRPLHFTNLILTASQSPSKSRSTTKPNSKLKSKAGRQRRLNTAMPLKYRDSVIQPLVTKRRSERSVTKIAAE